MTGLAGEVLHVVVGPQQHGVVRHGELVAAACGHRVVRLSQPRPLTPAEVGAASVLHVPWTDRLFAPRAPKALAAFAALVDPWLAGGRSLSVTLHDLPSGDSPVEDRRRDAYRGVVGRATGVVVSSRRELELVDRLDRPDGPERGDAALRSLRCIPLPVSAGAPAQPPGAGSQVGQGNSLFAGTDHVVVLGFIFPDRGYEHTIAELPPGVDLLALGRPSEGHEDLPASLADLASQTGHRMTTTGFVPDDDLAPALRAAGVPVAPNRRVAASGSIATWVGHGRRPLVPDSPYGRELAHRWPGALRLYDADEPGALRREIEAARADPALTWLSGDVRPGPSESEVADDYAVHLAACQPPLALPLGDGRFVVPGNRWDLLDGVVPAQPPHVTVVVPHHEAQADLDLVLTALTLQDHPASRLQVVVADDGSCEAPSLEAAADLDARLVRQERQGFRAAAARNLGASAADGDVLVFLDGDTVPEPGYVSHLVRLPALLPDALTVGRRRHADLEGWSAPSLREWLLGQGDPPTELTEPTWLRDGYTASRDLLDVDPRSYRFVISAVMALHRDLFTELGGFDEGFRAYGGEDWHLAHRAYTAGAVLAHVPAAVAWHDGPDWGARVADPARAREEKNLETLRLASHLPDPQARGGGSWDRPAVVLVLHFADPAEVLATSRAALAGDADCGIWVDHPGAHATVEALGDRRVTVGPPRDDVLATALAVVHLEAPARVTGLARLAGGTPYGPGGPPTEPYGAVGLPTGVLRTRRSTARAHRWADRMGLPEPVLADLLFGACDVAGPGPSRPVDLAHELAAIARETSRGTSP